MLTLLPVISTFLSVSLAASGNYSPSERRTLQTALDSSLHYSELNRFNQLCQLQSDSAVAQQFAAVSLQYDKLTQLLQDKLHTNNQDKLLQYNNQLTASVKQNVPTLTDCNDSKAYQALLDRYELSLFALDISESIDSPLSSQNSATQRKQAASRTNASALIARSYAIALVSVSDRELLSPVQQANYLHLDYQSRYIFKILEGWRNITAAYMGMHIFVDDVTRAKTAGQWLIFLDQNNHFIQAVSKDQANVYLDLLGEAEWRFDAAGNLIRK